MTTCVAASVDIALLGCGNVGGAFARLAAHDLSRLTQVRIATALVRDAARPRDGRASVPLTANPRTLFDDRPDVVVELLGGIEPARSLILDALERRIPVVTANKSLLARHGGELRAASRAFATPLLYEAAVLAGVPFLGTFTRRPQAATLSSLIGIANGTSNFVLTRCAQPGVRFEEALAEAQRRGYAEPDPRHDVEGLDAVEKLTVLLQHFAGREVDPTTIETSGIDALTSTQTSHALELGGVIKPLIYADWTNGIDAFAGPAFVPSAHVLSRVDGVENALILGGSRGRLLFQGPGAGPEVTAATVLDDVHEIATGVAPTPRGELKRGHAAAPETGWMVTIEGTRLPRVVDVSDLFAAHGVFAHRATERHSTGSHESRSVLAWPCPAGAIQGALDALARATGCVVRAVRALEVSQ